MYPGEDWYWCYWGGSRVVAVVCKGMDAEEGCCGGGKAAAVTNASVLRISDGQH